MRCFSWSSRCGGVAFFATMLSVDCPHFYCKILFLPVQTKTGMLSYRRFDHQSTFLKALKMEMRGVEPLSEHIAILTSTLIDQLFEFNLPKRR